MYSSKSDGPISFPMASVKDFRRTISMSLMESSVRTDTASKEDRVTSNRMEGADVNRDWGEPLAGVKASLRSEILR